MNKKKEVKKDKDKKQIADDCSKERENHSRRGIKDKKQIADDCSKKITYSTSESEKLDLLDIVEMYLCKSCVRI